MNSGCLTETCMLLSVCCAKINALPLHKISAALVLRIGVYKVKIDFWIMFLTVPHLQHEVKTYASSKWKSIYLLLQ